MSDPRYEQQETERAASEAARIGGGSGGPPADPAEAPVDEADGGEAEGFEEADAPLGEHASHADSQSAYAVLHDQRPAEQDDERTDGEGGHERSSHTDVDGSP